MVYKTGNLSIGEVCSKYSIVEPTLYDWTEKYEWYGIKGLKNSKKWNPYIKQLKDAAVKDYISGEYS